MSKLPSLSSREIIQCLRKAGFVDAPTRGKGSHHALKKLDNNNVVRLVIVPERTDIPV